MSATGFQIAFLYFAALFGAMLATRHAVDAYALSKEYVDPLGQALTFLLAGLVLVFVPALRRAGADFLRPPVPRAQWIEVAIATLLKLAVPFGIAGAIALDAILAQDAGVLARIPIQRDPEAELAFTLRPEMLALQVIVAWFIGPLLEEIFFRGFLYRAWERQWGWLAATLLTSTAFAACHPSHMTSSFLGLILFIAILRRTGSLRASIYAHCAFNILVFWPLLGHLVFAVRPGDPLAWSTWSVEIACFLAIAIGIPLYMFLARKPREAPFAQS